MIQGGFMIYNRELGLLVDINPERSDGIVTADVEILDPADLASSAWTKTEVTITTNADGTYDRVTVDTTPTEAPYILQAITGAAVNATACPPLTVSFKVEFEDLVWIMVQTQSGTAANRTWFRVDGSAAVGTNGANHSNAAISAPDGDGRRTVSLRMNANSGTAEIRVYFVDGDGVMTFAAIGDDTILMQFDQPSQPMVVSATNLVTGSVWSAPSIDTRPAFVSGWNNGRAAIRGLGSQYLLGTDPAVINDLDGSDEPFTVFAVCALPAGDSDVLFGLADASSTDRYTEVGFSSSSQPRFARRGNSDAGVIANATPAIDTSPHIVEWCYTGTRLMILVDGVEVFPDTLVDIGFMTVTRCGLFCRPASSVIEILAAYCQRLLVFGRPESDPHTVFMAAEARANVRQGLGALYGIAVS